MVLRIIIHGVHLIKAFAGIVNSLDFSGFDLLKNNYPIKPSSQTNNAARSNL